MKTTTILRLTATLLLLCASAPPVQAAVQWETFQLPVSRNSHSFKLWQRSASGLVVIATVVGDTYYVGGLENAYYFELKAQFDRNGGEYWIEDITPPAHETSPVNKLGLTHAQWRVATSTPQHYMALPQGRMGHAFSFEQGGVAPCAMTKGALQQEAVVNASGAREWLSYGYFEGWAQISPSGQQFYRVTDLNTGERTGWLPFTQSNLVPSAQWFAPDPIDTSTLRAVTIHLAPGQAWQDFVLYTSDGMAQSIRAVEGVHWNGTAFVSDHRAVVSGSVSVGAVFWLVRVADGRSSLQPGIDQSQQGGVGHMGEENQTLAWGSFFPPAGLPSGQTISVGFEISDARYGHREHLSVRYSDGRPSTPVTWLSAGGILVDGYNDSEASNVLHYDLYGATVDDTQDWWLFDAAAYNGGGEAFDFRATRIYDGWHPGHPVVPTQHVSFVMNASRRNHLLLMYQGNDPLGWPVTATGGVFDTPVRSPVAPFPILYNMTTYYAHARGENQLGQRWTLRDLTTGEEMGGSASSIDLSTWAPSASIALNINHTRWGHRLSLHQAGHPSRTIHRGAIQGVTYWNAGQPVFSPTGHFTATSRRNPAVTAYTIVDETTGEEYVNPTDPQLKGWAVLDPNADADNDGLPNWYELMIGTSSSDANVDADGHSEGWDTDGDHISDFDEMRYGFDPLSTNDMGEDADSDGASNGWEILNGRSPRDPFNGSAPVVEIVEGNDQLAWTGQIDDFPLMVRLLNSDGASIPNQPVVFTAPSGTLAISKTPGSPEAASQTAMTNFDGYTAIFFRQPTTPFATTMVEARAIDDTGALVATVSFSTQSVGGDVAGAAAPTDLDGTWIESATSSAEAYELTWVDASANEIAFVIEKSKVDEAHYIPVAYVPPNTTSWRDYDLHFETEVYYRVVSVAVPIQ